MEEDGEDLNIVKDQEQDRHLDLIIKEIIQIKKDLKINLPEEVIVEAKVTIVIV